MAGTNADGRVKINVSDLQQEGTIALTSEEIVQRRSMQNVLDKLLPSESSSRSDESHQERRRHRPSRLNVWSKRSHNTILVDAPRGGGKTTFLTTLLSHCERGLHPFDDSKSEKVERIYSLGILDPTTVEDKQNVLVIIIDLIREAVHHELNEKNRATERSDNFENCLYKLARGLKVLDHVGPDRFHGDDWADPDFVLDEGLQDAKAAHELERHFHDLVDEALKIVEAKKFVLAIDDIDTRFERGWPVLEALRKYLTTPKLQIILAGDLHLFSMLVRSHQWQQLGQQFVDIAADLDKTLGSGTNTAPEPRLARMEDHIGQLEEQYLIKILPNGERIKLRTLWQIERDEGVEIGYWS